MVSQCVCHGLNNDRRHLRSWCWLLATNDSQMLKCISQFKKINRKDTPPRAIWREEAITSLRTLGIYICGIMPQTSWMLMQPLLCSPVIQSTDRVLNWVHGDHALVISVSVQRDALGFATLVTLWFIRAGSDFFTDCRTPSRAALRASQQAALNEQQLWAHSLSSSWRQANYHNVTNDTE